MEPTLDQGPQTQITSLVLEESKKIKGKNLLFISNLICYIHNEYKLTQTQKIDKRVRDLDEIISTKSVNGCTDYAHLFIALCRSKKIPALFVDVLDLDWVKNPGQSIKGHVFVKIKLNNQFFLIDPTRGNINPLNKINNYVLIGKGVDFLSIYGSMDSFKKSVKEKLKEYVK